MKNISKLICVICALFFLSICTLGCEDTSMQSHENSNNNESVNEIEQENNASQILEEVDHSDPVMDLSYWKIRFKVRNISSEPINTVSLIINKLDEQGDILSTTYPQNPNVIEPGQAIWFECLVNVDEKADSVQVAGFNCYQGDKTSGNKGSFIDGILEGKIVQLR